MSVARVGERFWTPRRQRVYPVMLVLLAVFWWVAFNAYRAANDEHYGADFIVFYAAGKLALDGDAADAYDPALLHEKELDVTPHSRIYPYYYPPPYQLLLAPLAVFPYWLALGGWLAATGAALFAAARRAATRWDGGRVLALAVPVFVNVAYGQNGLLTAALLGGGLFMVDRNPLVAGTLLGGLVYKPQFALVAAVALLAGRRWREVGVAVATAATLALLSLVILGDDVWSEFFHSTGDARQALYSAAAEEKRITAFGALLQLGMPRAAAYVGHALLAAPVLAVCAAAWWRGWDRERRIVLALVGTMLVTPYAFVYDLVVLVPVAALLWTIAERDGWRGGERLWLGLCLTAAAWSWAIAFGTGVQLAWVALAGLFVVVARPAPCAAAAAAE